MLGQGIENTLYTHFLPQFLQHESAHSPAHTIGLAGLSCSHEELKPTQEFSAGRLLTV